MTSTYFLLGQQTCGHHKGKRELIFLEHLLYTRHQGHSDTNNIICSPIISFNTVIPV